MDNPKALYSVSEAAKLLKVTRQEVVRRIWRGFIKAEMVGKQYIISKKEIDKALAKR